MRSQFGFEQSETQIISGFAGAGTSQRIAATAEAFRALGFRHPSIVISDCELALEALGGDGVLFIAGTGSVCIGRKGSVQIRCGGNGYVLGDEASGFYVGRRALNEILNADYRSQRPTAMTPLVLKHFGLQRPEEIKSLVYGDAVIPKGEIAAAAPIVFECAADGDPIAASIISAAVEEIALSVHKTRSALGLLEAECVLGLRGGLFRAAYAQRLLIAPLEARSAERSSRVSIRLLESDTDPHVILIPGVRSILARHAEGRLVSASHTSCQRDTERTHPLSAGMDAMSGPELVKLFNRGNEEVFDALLDPDFGRELTTLAARIRAKGAESLVLGGAGTSGRIAHYLAKHFAGDLSVRSWIAGGLRALSEAVEGAEDDVPQAMADVRQLLDGATNPYFIGISCGLSAPCVAGALLEARNRGAGIAAFGMTPGDTARAESVAGGGLSFAQVLNDLRSHEGDRYSELTVQAGPELLTGSSRLKGGTATWLALYSLCESLRSGQEPTTVLHREVTRLKSCLVDPSVAEALEIAAAVIRRGGDIIYVAQGALADAAALDASEIAPTFGVSKERVRVVRVDSAQGDAVSGTSRDLVVCLGDSDPEGQVAASIGAQSVRFYPSDFITAKVAVLNPLSTGAFSRAGYVFGNRMLNVRPSNSKLFERAIGIVAEVAQVDLNQARRSLIAAMTDCDEPRKEILEKGADELCRSATGRTLVVPRAIAHAVGISLPDAECLLTEATPLREVIARFRDLLGD
jgi:N-acetylmuramic acid 6-phosphate (MurNAc-6-P) etherase/N-acetylglucosamine kinase-like BadF-type ATPase